MKTGCILSPSSNMKWHSLEKTVLLDPDECKRHPYMNVEYLSRSPFSLNYCQMSGWNHEWQPCLCSVLEAGGDHLNHWVSQAGFLG